MRKQEIGVVIHYPKTLYGWRCLARHAVAVWDLIEQDMSGKLEGPLSARVQMLDADQEKEAMERHLKKHPPKKRKNVWQNITI